MADSEASAPSDRADKRDAIEQYLKQVILHAGEGINTRDFAPDSHRWAGFSRHFRYEAFGVGEVDFAGFLEYEKNVCALHPGFQILFKQINAVQISEDQDYAEVYCETDILGIPDGMVRPAMATFKFRRWEGRWECMGMETMAVAPASGM